VNVTALYSSDFDSPRIAVVPIGSWEQHGSHLPLNTDTIIAETLAVRALDIIGDERVLRLPTVNYSASDEHRGFAGTSSIGDETAERTFTLIARSLSENSPRVCGVIFVNGHGGNVASMQSSSSALTHHGVPHHFWSPRLESNGDLHAGHVETSVMLAINAMHVRTDLRTVGVIGDTRNLITKMREHGVQHVSPNGVIGDASSADASYGSDILARWTADLVLTVRSSIATWIPPTSDDTTSTATAP
jgi:creatinine amidohydrolase